jgi:hypothetical protein
MAAFASIQNAGYVLGGLKTSILPASSCFAFCRKFEFWHGLLGVLPLSRLIRISLCAG